MKFLKKLMLAGVFGTIAVNAFADPADCMLAFAKANPYEFKTQFHVNYAVMDTVLGRTFSITGVQGTQFGPGPYRGNLNWLGAWISNHAGNCGYRRTNIYSYTYIVYR